LNNVIAQHDEEVEGTLRWFGGRRRSGVQRSCRIAERGRRGGRRCPSFSDATVHMNSTIPVFPTVEMNQASRPLLSLIKCPFLVY